MDPNPDDHACQARAEATQGGGKIGLVFRSMEGDAPIRRPRLCGSWNLAQVAMMTACRG